MEFAVFAVAAVLILGGALGVVFSRNPVHAALFLVQTLFGVALVFILREAHFLAAVEVIVYAGAIVILFLFVIMLLGVDTTDDLGIEPIAGQRPLAVVLGAATAGLLIVGTVIATDVITGRNGVNAPINADQTDIEQIGEALFTDYAFAFLTTAALLTIGVIGAVVLTRRSQGVIDSDQAESWDLPALVPAGALDDDHHEDNHHDHHEDRDDAAAPDAAPEIESETEEVSS